MFAPPDPTTLSAAPPLADGPLPGSPSLPTLAPVGAPTLPAVPSASADSSSAGAHPQPADFDAEHADDADVTPAQQGDLLAAPCPLVRTAWLRRVTIWANVLAVPGFFVGDYVGAALTVMTVAALLMWSALVAFNVRRCRPATRHGRAPHPLMVVLSWMLAPAVACAAAVVIVTVARWADAGSFDEQGSRTMALAAAVFVSGLALLIASYQPYRTLAKCARWVKADPGRFRKWFAAPIVGGLIAIVAQVLAGLVVLTDNADGSSSGATLAAAGLWALSFTLPWLGWLIFGSRAMRSLDLAVTHAHGRAVREAQDPAEIDAAYIGRKDATQELTAASV